MDRISGLLLGPARLVTLTGLGGIGKTTLAEEAVRRLRRARRAPVFWVRLARLARDSDATAVAEAVAGAVLSAGFVGPSEWDGVLTTLTIRDGAGHDVQSVLVLDNCEHVLAGVGPVIAGLLDDVPGLTIVATSREQIGWIDEYLVDVSPLSTDQSLELFQQRAEMTGHPITGPAQLDVVGRICRHLHGNPLYIRLAAARMFYEPLPMILHQLSGDADDTRIHWEHGPRVGVDRNHRTISDVIGWSYELCSEKEKLLFDRLSVFAPGYDPTPDTAATAVEANLEAIETVCSNDTPGGDVRLERGEIRGLLDRLVARSLVSAHITATSVRYSLPESLRMFARERLVDRSTAETDEPARLARRHQHYYRDKIAYAQTHWCSPAERELMDWARGAWDNIQLAIETCLNAPDESEVGLEIATGLIGLRTPFVAGSLSTARRWDERALHRTLTRTNHPTDLQITAMAQVAWIALWEGRRDQAEGVLDQAVAACIPEPDIRRHWRRDPGRDLGLPAIVEFAWGLELMTVEADPQAITVFSRAREKYRAQSDSSGEALSSLFEAMGAAILGSRREALEIAERHLEHITEAGAMWAKSWAEVVWAIALIKYERSTDALPFVRRALRYQINACDHWGAIFAATVHVWGTAHLIADLTSAGNTDKRRLTALASEIGLIVGGIGTLRARLGVENDGGLIPASDETEIAIKIASDLIGAKAFAAVQKRGSQLHPERNEVLQVAAGTLPIEAIVSAPSAVTPTPSHWHTLTDAEQEVAILAAAGWVNSAIAVRRGTSTRTVDAQASSILRKLAVTSRDDIIQFITADAIDRVKAERERRPRRPHRQSHPRP